MYPIPSHEHLVETRKCRQCEADFPITDKDMEFYEKVSPSFAGKKYLIPPPTLCPDCRAQRRLAWRNERKLYKRKCDATGKDMLSMFPPSSRFRVYHPDEWYTYDFLKEWRWIDWDRSFFDQFNSLLLDVPHMWLSVASNQNCDYTNQCGNSKDCYYSFDVWMAENCLYSNFIDDSTFLVDSNSTHESHVCYDCIDAIRCSHSFSLLRCEDCSFSRRLVDCKGCKYCLECINLQNKKYYYRNQKYSKEEWENIYAKYIYNEAEWGKFLQKQPRKNLYITWSDGCLGDAISYSKNTTSSFETKDAENAKYIDRSRILRDCMDIRWFGNNLDLSYECLSAGINAHNILFSSHCWSEVSRLYYCHYCIHGTTDCFGCIGLQWQRYCILNKQYTKAEYEALVPKIIEKMMSDGEWGEFFPASMSPFGYNETVANEYFPLEKEEALKERFNWSDYEPPFAKVEKIIPASKLPDTIESIPDDILNWAIECEESGKPFRIIRQELEFYRKYSLPVPRRHPNVRHMDRMQMRNPRKLFERKCHKCGKDMITTYTPCEMKWSLEVPLGCPPERPEKVYCEVCYEKEVLS
jgi:Zn ribbon nucleic-acid-binding protein